MIPKQLLLSAILLTALSAHSQDRFSAGSFASASTIAPRSSGVQPPDSSGQFATAGGQLPKFGTQSTAFDTQSPTFWTQSPTFGAQSPTIGTQSPTFASEAPVQVYTVHPKVEIPLFVAAAGWTFYGFAKIGNKDGSSQQTIDNLSKSNIPWYDRWAVRPYNRSVDKLSYVPFDAAMPFPLVFLALDKKMRKDYWKLTFLYAEAMAFTGALYTSSVHYLSRYRPLVYSAESPMDVRTASNARNSFFAGHVALVATSTFFVASAYADYHPDSKYKWVMYGIAGAATLTTGYLRHRAGEHFPSDILVGTVIGTASGLLTPRLHQTKLIKNQKLSIIPFAGRSPGLAMFYKL